MTMPGNSEKAHLPIAHKQGTVRPNQEAVFLPEHTASNPCASKVFTVGMHHQHAEFASPGDNVNLNVKGLDKQSMPQSGDVKVYKKDTILGQTKEITAQVRVLDKKTGDQKYGVPALREV